MTQDQQTPEDMHTEERPHQLTEEQVANMSYADYLKLVNPGKSDEEIQKMIRKENRYTWMGRIQIVLLILILIVVIYFVVTK